MSQTKYYAKELPEQPIWINGHPIKFDFHKTSDPVMIQHLDAAIAQQRGGIVQITEAQYEEELKKKQSGSHYDNGSPRLRQQGLSALNRDLAAVAATDRRNSTPRQFATQPGEAPRSSISGRPMPDPIQVPSPNQFSGLLKPPPTAKITPP